MRSLVFVVALSLALSAAAAPELVEPGAHPVEGEATTLQLLDGGAPAAGVSLTALYRKNAHDSLQHEQAVGTTGADGTVAWTPDSAGVVVLQWEEGQSQVSVLHSGTPVGGVLIALLAGLALLGGSVLFFVQMLRQPEPEIVEETEEIGEPPST